MSPSGISANVFAHTMWTGDIWGNGSKATRIGQVRSPSAFLFVDHVQCTCSASRSIGSLGSCGIISFLL